MTTVRQQFNLRTSMSNDVIERKPYQASAPQCQTEVHHAAETSSAVNTTDASNKRQQQPDSTSSNPLQLKPQLSLLMETSIL
ncbi:hypothetical protein Tco_0603570 [Tanacetum coccineum]